MKEIELQPKPLKSAFGTTGALLLISAIIVGVLTLPNIQGLYQEFPNENSVIIVLITTIVVILLLIIAGVATISSAKNRKIWIEDGVLYLLTRNLLGKETIKAISLKNLVLINNREKRGWAFTGKVVIPTVSIWIVFNYRDKTSEEFLENGWDMGTLKKLLLHIKEKYPQVKINTNIYRDSSEELTGLNVLSKE